MLDFNWDISGDCLQNWSWLVNLRLDKLRLSLDNLWLSLDKLWLDGGGHDLWLGLDILWLCDHVCGGSVWLSIGHNQRILLWLEETVQWDLIHHFQINLHFYL